MNVTPAGTAQVFHSIRIIISRPGTLSAGPTLNQFPFLLLRILILNSPPTAFAARSFIYFLYSISDSVSLVQVLFSFFFFFYLMNAGRILRFTFFRITSRAEENLSLNVRFFHQAQIWQISKGIIRKASVAASIILITITPDRRHICPELKPPEG